MKDRHSQESLLAKGEKPSEGYEDHGDSNAKSPGLVRRGILFVALILLTASTGLNTVQFFVGNSLPHEGCLSPNSESSSWRRMIKLEANTAS